ncbi:hypothetical protein PSI23_21955, partial [Xenorhabdus sp. XENO-10]|nr:hypothetical protein [Xenorhabdus yunnanensis]
MVDSHGEPHTSVSDMDILKKLTPELLNKSKALIERAGILSIDCNLKEDALEWLFKNSGNVPIFVNPVSSYKAGVVRNWLSYIHTIRPNRLEAEKMVTYSICCFSCILLTFSGNKMATGEVKCRFCQQTESVRKHGTGQGERQRYRCLSCRRTFQL